MALVLVTDPLAKEGIAALEAAGHVVRTGTVADITDDIAMAQAWIVRSGTQLDETLLAKATALRAIGRAGVGVDNIDVGAATKRGIAVFNAPTGNITSACEQAWALMLAACRHIPRADAGMKQRQWLRKELRGMELAGKTLFLIGLGKIGRMMAKRALAFDMKVVGFDPFVTAEAAKSFGVERVELADGFARADIISLHTPLVASTRDIICKENLAHCQQPVVIVNAARGPLVVEEDVLAALEDGSIRAAGLDVWCDEPPSSWDLAQHPHVVATPHLGASTTEAQVKAATQAVEQVIHCLATGSSDGALNAQTSTDDLHAPWALLAKKLAHFAMQCSREVDGLEIACTPDLQVETLQASAVLGAALAVSEANAINAPVIAKERGWAIAHRILPEDEATFVRLTVKGGCDVAIEGTWSPHYGARVTSIDGFDVEFRPEGRFLLTRHEDIPGVLANITQVLAEAEVNVAGMSLGRNANTGQALAVIRIDGSIPRAAREALRQIKSIQEAHRIRLMA